MLHRAVRRRLGRYPGRERRPLWYQLVSLNNPKGSFILNGGFCTDVHFRAGQVLIHGLTPPIDKSGFWVHNIAIVGSALKPDRPLRLQMA